MAEGRSGYGFAEWMTIRERCRGFRRDCLRDALAAKTQRSAPVNKFGSRSRASVITLGGVTHDPRAIANFFLALAESEGRSITPLQLTKLVYLAHGWYLGVTGVPLLNENPEAWPYGPVLPSIYHEFKAFGNRPITRHATELDWNTFDWKEITLPTDSSLDSLRHFLRAVWGLYGKKSGLELSSLTHKPGTPWYKTWSELGGKDRKGVDIPDELIRQHYQELKKQHAGAAK